MNIVWTFITIACLGQFVMADGPATKTVPAKKPVPIPAGLDIVNRLRDALKSGTPTEKEAALEMIRGLKPLALIPEIIEAIEDPTALPDHTTPDCKTGWVFVGHQAASVLAEMARAIDGIEVGMKRGSGLTALTRSTTI